MTLLSPLCSLLPRCKVALAYQLLFVSQLLTGIRTETVLDITKPLGPYKDESEANLFAFDRGFAEYFADPDPGSPTEVDSIVSITGEAIKQNFSDTSEDIWLQPGSSELPLKVCVIPSNLEACD